MRTDSLRIADDAQKEAVAYLTENYGSEYVKAKQYKTKKNAQDAHEAIRPTSINIKPIDIKDKTYKRPITDFISLFGNDLPQVR